MTEGSPIDSAEPTHGRDPHPPRRPRAIALATFVALAGLTTAIVAGSTPVYGTTNLPTSDTFFALADSGDRLYAAADNGGSILLERSSDQGATWSATPVPYSAIAGGVPWQRATVAADGGTILLAAASTPDAVIGVPAGPVPALVVNCTVESTLLLATSADGGLEWTSSIVSLPGIEVTSIGGAVEGSDAAVVWLGSPGWCSGTSTGAGAFVSADDGVRWSSSESFSASGESAATGSGIEIAPEEQGLVTAFEAVNSTSSGSDLELWTYNSTVGATFSLATILTAPQSWTLQGDPSTPAILVTPTYLVVLDAAPYTALPFDELSSDAPSIGSLPNVVSVVPTTGSTLEIAATTSDDLGVDCWQMDTITLVTTQTCHVPLGGFLAPGAGNLPIVALLDGGGWWVAIGASGYSECGGGVSCPPPSSFPGNSSPPASAPSSGGAAVGTSICTIGCSAANGVAAYSYRPTSTADLTGIDIGAFAATVLAAIGLVVLSRRRNSARPRAPPPSPSDPTLGATVPTVDDVRPIARRQYRRSLVVWAVVWAPLTALAFVPQFGVPPAAVAFLVILLAIAGALTAGVIAGDGRRRLQTADGWTADHVVLHAVNGTGGDDPVGTRGLATATYLSWIAIGGFLVLASLAVSASNGPFAAVTGAALAALLVVAVGCRIAVHLGFTKILVNGGDETADRRRELRRVIGVGLVLWNPLVGFLLGWVLSPVVSIPPSFLAWAFLPVTLLGIALLAGAFGPTLEVASPELRDGATVDVAA